MKIIISIIILFSTQLFAGIGVGYSSIGALPVQLSSFTAILNGNSVELHWTTATEVNNYGFDVERKSSQTSPIQTSWSKIGFVRGNGNSNSPKDYSFVDKSISNGKYSYRLKQIDTDGKFEYSNVVNIDINVSAKYFLNQNYPNPFNPSTIIAYSIPASSNVTLKVYNVLGKLVTTLVNKYQQAGSYRVYFDASFLSNGVYFYRLQAGNFSATNKMLLLK
jgi:Secretion system C-terminal sorting domain